jgi:hypothetical protein
MAWTNYDDAVLAGNPEQLQVCFYPGEDDRPDQVNKLLKINPSWFSATEYRE